MLAGCTGSGGQISRRFPSWFGHTKVLQCIGVGHDLYRGLVVAGQQQLGDRTS